MVKGMRRPPLRGRKHYCKYDGRYATHRKVVSEFFDLFLELSGPGERGPVTVWRGLADLAAGANSMIADSDRVAGSGLGPSSPPAALVVTVT